MRRGQGMTISTVGKLVLVLLTIVLLIWLLYTWGYRFSESLDECPQYCAQDCAISVNGRIAGAPDPRGEEWCEAGIWDLSNDTIRASMHNIQETENHQYKGQDLGLRCCTQTGFVKETPITFLGKWLRIDEQTPEERRNDITSPPRIVVYFGDGQRVLPSGSSVIVVSGRSQTFDVEIKNIKSRSSSGTGNVFVATNGKGEEIKDTPELECVVQLINENDVDLLKIDGNNAFKNDFKEKMTRFDSEAQSLCGVVGDGPVGLRDPVQITFPEELKGVPVTLAIAVQEIESGRDVVRHNLDIDVSDQIKISGLDENWVYQRTLSLSCVDVSCNRFNYTLVAQADSCGSENFQNQAPSAVMEQVNRGKLTINTPEENYLCIRAEGNNQLFYKKSELPVRIDRTPPQLTANFDPLKYQTEVVCTEDTNGGSGCAAAVGFFYIEDPVDFLGAIFSGDPRSYCPQEHSLYGWTTADIRTEPNKAIGEIPYLGQQSVKVLCVRVKDNAGNIVQDDIITYDSWGIAFDIISDQLSNGGPGSGYFGYS